MPLLSCIASQFVVTGILVYVMGRFARRRKLLDVPNQRSLHTVAVPRLGGAAFGPVIFGGILFWQRQLGQVPSPGLRALLLCGTAIYILGLVDDLLSLKSGLRLVIQGMIAGAFLVVVSPALPYWPGFPPVAVWILLWIWIVGLTNAYNFMDGIDGLAATQAIVASGFWIIASGGMASLIGIVATCIAGAVAGFAVQNWPPARIFMGDAGSTTLGFLFGALPIVSTCGPNGGWLHFAAGTSVMLPFVLDSATTFARRILQKENVLKAHRTHLYQRLSSSRYSSRSVVLLFGCLATVGALGGLMVLERSPFGATLSFVIVLSGFLGLIVLERRASGGSFKSASSAGRADRSGPD